MAYQAKKELVLGRQLKVQKLSIPFLITAHVTPGSKAVSVDEPGILFLQVEDLDSITEATGAVADDTTLPTMTGETDSTGIFFAAFNIGEVVSKVVSCKLVQRDATEILACEILESADDGLVVIVKINSAVNISTTDLDAVLELEYIV